MLFCPAFIFYPLPIHKKMAKGEKKISKNTDRFITTMCVMGMLSSAIIGSFLTKQ